MDGYRDDRGAALARLEDLEAAHLRRLRAGVPERQKLLEEERAALAQPRRLPGGILRYGAYAVLVIGFSGAGASFGLLVGCIGFVMMVLWAILDVREAASQRRRIARVDAALDGLRSLRVRVAPAELDAIHVRIAELEAEEADQTAEAARRLEIASAIAETRK